MRFDIVTIFPEIFRGIFDTSILGKAVEKGIVEINIHNLRDFAHDRHSTTDDYPYGGGAGMVMKVEPFDLAVTELKKQTPEAPVALMTPQGEVFSHNKAKELSALPGLILLCGRYEGVDERVRHMLCDMEISIGDYVLTGGEIPAAVVIDSVARLIPGVVGESDSTLLDSHADGLLEHAHYTRPAEYKGRKVPEILLTGHHKNIETWRREQSMERTKSKRPDLIEKANVKKEERRAGDEFGDK